MRLFPRTVLSVVAAEVMAAYGGVAGVLCAQGTSAADTRPTIAVMYFTNGAILHHADYDALSKGIADMLITEMSTNPKIRVVERDQLQQLLKEQDLDTSTRVDPSTAVRVGKLLGAQHMIFGAFVSDLKGRMRLDARAVNVETSQIEHVESVSDNADNLLTMISTLGEQMNKGMQLPARPSNPSSQGARGAGDESAKPGNRYQALLIYSQALVEEDKGHRQQAVALYKQFLSTPPLQYALAQRAQAEGKVRTLQQGG